MNIIQFHSNYKYSNLSMINIIKNISYTHTHIYKKINVPLLSCDHAPTQHVVDGMEPFSFLFSLLFGQYDRFRELDDHIPSHLRLRHAGNKFGRVETTDPLNERFPVTIERFIADQSVVGTVLLNAA